MTQSHQTLAFVGGTGPEGLGLAVRFALAGYPVIIGSRKIERAQEAVQMVLQAAPNGNVRGMENAAAVRAADIVLITVPYSGQKDTLIALRDAIGSKLVIDTVVPLDFSAKGKIRMVAIPEGSATQEAQALLPSARVIGAFHNLSAKELLEIQHEVPSDVVVTGNDAEAKKTVMALAHKIKGVRAIDAGGLDNSHYVEAVTALLLNINRVYKTQSMIKIVGV